MKLTYTTTDTTLPPPKYAYPGDTCFDLYAAEDVTIKASPTLVSTGLRFKIPKGYGLKIYPRSSMAKRGFGMPNSPGIIDAGYRGIVYVVLTYPGIEKIKHGDRIAQAELVPVVTPKLVLGDVPLSTARGEGGFGSSGT